MADHVLMSPLRSLCANCTFWRWDRNGPDYRNRPEGEAMLLFMSGECRRHAPALRRPNDCGGPRDEAVWPRLAGDEWCGDYMWLGIS